MAEEQRRRGGPEGPFRRPRETLQQRLTAGEIEAGDLTDRHPDPLPPLEAREANVRRDVSGK